MPVRPMPTPRIAVSSGMPAATSEPNVMISTMNATATPISSAVGAAAVSLSASPPTATTNPVSPAWALASSRAPVSAAVRSTAGLEYVMVA